MIFSLDLYNYDTSGDYLKYFIHLDETYSGIYNPVEAYLSGLNLTGSDLYFINGSTVYPYVNNAISAQIPDPSFIDMIVSDPSSMTKFNSLGEDLSKLKHYFTTNHLGKVVEQNYYYDTLNIALSGVAYLSPYSYATELENILGVSFGGLSGCPPDSLYLLASTYNIYGSKRLGTMDAKIKRQDGDNLFSRKLGAKQYELTDHLGNVMATISDKKIHPQELLTAGSQDIDTTMGFQADVTGRYDYYPFGMEIMSRSGNFTNIDYTTDVNKLLYSGLLKSCDAYSTIPISNNIDTKYCITAENLYGQKYVDTLRIDHDDVYWNGIRFFNFTIDLPLDEVIGALDPEGNYSIQFTFTSKWRWVYGSLPELGIESIDGNPDATLNELRAAKVKYLTFNYTGAELDSIANGNELHFYIKVSSGQSGKPWDPFVKINNIRVTQTFKNTTMPLAMRDEKAYTYGFQGMQRTDEWSGSGNHYTTAYRPYDARLGRWTKLDPVFHPWQSAYSAFNNNPIYFVDPQGLAGKKHKNRIPNKRKAGRTGFGSKFKNFFSNLFDKVGDLLHKNNDLKTTKTVDDKGRTNTTFDQAVEITAKGKPLTPLDRKGFHTLTTPDREQMLKQVEEPGQFLSPEVNSALSFTGTGFDVTNELFKYGAAYEGGKPVYGKLLERELAAGKAFNKVATHLSVVGNTFTAVSAIHSFVLWQSGITNGESFAYDMTMIGVARVPYFGIPLSIGGSIYKEEILKMDDNFRGHTPSSNSTYCFVAGTKVLIGDQWVSIELLQENAFVSSYNFDRRLSQLMRISFAKSKTAKNIYEIVTNVDTFLVTAKHPFYVEGKKWVEAQKLQEGNVLKNLSGKKIKVRSVKQSERSQMVYNIEVDGNHNYFVGKGKVLVHNKTLGEEQIVIQQLNEQLKEQREVGTERK